jgi:hypothetical protein
MIKFNSLTFDLEEFSLPIDYGKKVGIEEMFQVSYEGSEELRKLLERFDIKVTFFVTRNFAQKFPDLIRGLSKKGHEIALHAINFYNSRSLLKEKEFLEKISRSKVIGIRTHKLQLPLFDSLRKIGIKYDSSLHPTYVPGRYNNLTHPRKPFFVDGVLEIPISVVPLLRLPFSFVWFRNFGLRYVKTCTLLAFKGQHFMSLYFHSWEFRDLKSFDLPFYIKKNTGKKMGKLLKEYIKWCLQKNFKFSPLRDCIKVVYKG